MKFCALIQLVSYGAMYTHEMTELVQKSKIVAIRRVSFRELKPIYNV